MQCSICGKSIIYIRSHTEKYKCDSMPRLFSYGGNDTAITVDGTEVMCDFKLSGHKRGVGYIKHECKHEKGKNR